MLGNLGWIDLNMVYSWPFSSKHVFRYVYCKQYIFIDARSSGVISIPLPTEEY